VYVPEGCELSPSPPCHLELNAPAVDMLPPSKSPPNQIDAPATDVLLTSNPPSLQMEAPASDVLLSLQPTSLQMEAPASDVMPSSLPIQIEASASDVMLQSYPPLHSPLSSVSAVLPQSQSPASHLPPSKRGKFQFLAGGACQSSSRPIVPVEPPEAQPQPSTSKGAPAVLPQPSTSFAQYRYLSDSEEDVPETFTPTQVQFSNIKLYCFFLKLNFYCPCCFLLGFFFV
jgi:hypothetical protein